jgi:uncharacterized protein (TIGR02452 family)
MNDQWNATVWDEQFREASRTRNAPLLRALRQDVFQTTVEAVKARRYRQGSAVVSLDVDDSYAALHKDTVFYESTNRLTVPADRQGRFETEVAVSNADCLEAAEALAKEGARPAVLNMASRNNPGGGVHGGAGAQEENIFRRSNLFWSLYQFAPYAGEYDVPLDRTGRSYPIPRDSGGIYSPPATVFRSSEASGYTFLEQPYSVAFLTVPAISRPGLIWQGSEQLLAPVMADATCTKIRAIFRIAAAHDHSDLVLSAFGCGAFRNPPRHMARLFREVLGEGEFDGVFHRVVFAIFDDHNAFLPTNPEGNFKPFKEELMGRLKSVSQ